MYSCWWKTFCWTHSGFDLSFNLVGRGCICSSVLILFWLSSLHQVTTSWSTWEGNGDTDRLVDRWPTTISPFFLEDLQVYHSQSPQLQCTSGFRFKRIWAKAKLLCHLPWLPCTYGLNSIAWWPYRILSGRRRSIWLSTWVRGPSLWSISLGRLMILFYFCWGSVNRLQGAITSLSGRMTASASIWICEPTVTWQPHHFVDGSSTHLAKKSISCVGIFGSNLLSQVLDCCTFYEHVSMWGRLAKRELGIGFQWFPILRCP